MSEFFVPEDFYTEGDLDTMSTPLKAADKANKKLLLLAIKGYSQKHRGEWAFTERTIKGDTHRALLLNIEEIKPCIHEKEKVFEKFGGRAQDQFYGYECECGAEVEPAAFKEKEK